MATNSNENSESVQDRIESRAPKFGIAIIYLGDLRALAVTARSLAHLNPRPARTVIVEHPAGLRPLSKIDGLGVDDWIHFSPAMNPRLAALNALNDCDVIALVQEGTVLGPSFLSVEQARFAENEGLRVAMVTSDRSLDLDDFLENGDQTDPFKILMTRGMTRSRLAPLYFSPCMVLIAPRRGDMGSFENHARRSGWASARVFLDSAPFASAAVEAASGSFGLIANQPDRREAYAQGREACKALYRFSASHDRYRNLARSDIRKLFWQQLAGIMRRSRSRSRLQFVWGMISALRDESTARRRFARDVADMT